MVGPNTFSPNQIRPSLQKAWTPQAQTVTHLLLTTTPHIDLPAPRQQGSSGGQRGVGADQNLQVAPAKSHTGLSTLGGGTLMGPVFAFYAAACISCASLQSRPLLRLDEAVLRSDGEAVSRPGQVKVQLSGGLVLDLNLPG